MVRRLRACGAAVRAHVVFAGRLAGTEVVRALQHAEALVVPSRRMASGRTEGCPVVVIEALLAGTPVLAARVGGLPEILPGESLFEPGSVEAIIAGLATLERSLAPPSSPPPWLTRRGTARTLLSLLSAGSGPEARCRDAFPG